MNCWERTILAYASLSDATLIAAGLALGAAIGYFGWTLPHKGAGPQPAVAVP